MREDSSLILPPRPWLFPWLDRFAGDIKRESDDDLARQRLLLENPDAAMEDDNYKYVFGETTGSRLMDKIKREAAAKTSASNMALDQLAGEAQDALMKGSSNDLKNMSQVGLPRPSPFSLSRPSFLTAYL